MAGKTKANSLFVPVNLDSKIQGLSHKDQDGIRWLTHFLIMDRVLGKKSNNGWVGIHSKVLTEALSLKNYKATIDKAVALKIIKVDNGYKVSEPGIQGYPKKYRLLKPFSEEKWHRVEVKDNDILSYLGRRAQGRDWGQFTDAHKHLWKWLQKVRIQDVPNLDEGSQEWIPFDALRKRDFRRSVCSYGRFHSNLTRLKREFRPYLRINGSELQELDISNCQPLLFAWLVCSFHAEKLQSVEFNLDKLIINNKEDKKDNNKESTDTVLSYVLLNEVPELVKPLKNKGVIPEDALKLLKLCESGQFYEYFLKKAVYDPTDKALRNQKKQQILTQFYDNWSLRRSETYEFLKVLKEDFPSAYKVCESVKRNNFQDLARLMQRIESHLIIDTICEELRLKYPDVPVITVHDAIFTTPENVEKLKKVVRINFKEKLGINVKFKGEPSGAPAGALTREPDSDGLLGGDVLACVS